MLRKSMLALLTAIVICIPVMPVMAHGSNHKTVTYSKCSVGDCNETGIHTHDGITYCGHVETENHTTHKNSHNSRNGHH